MSERSGPTDAEARCESLLMDCMRVFVDECQPLPAELDKFCAGLDQIRSIFTRRIVLGRHYQNPPVRSTIQSLCTPGSDR